MIISRSDNGFTLVELMMALVITMVGLMGLLKALEFSMQYNATNQLRDEAVQVGERVMAFQKVRPFSQLTTSHPAPLASRIRSGSVRYNVVVTDNPRADATPSPKETLVRVTVTWDYKGNHYSHEVMSVRSQ